MTREEAIKYLKEMKDECNDTFHKVRYVTQEEVLEMAIQALSQEPCDDAISRDAVIKLAYDMSEIDGEHFTEPCMVVDVEDIQKLPSVNPTSNVSIQITEREKYGRFN